VPVSTNWLLWGLRFSELTLCTCCSLGVSYKTPRLGRVGRPWRARGCHGDARVDIYKSLTRGSSVEARPWHESDRAKAVNLPSSAFVCELAATRSFCASGPSQHPRWRRFQVTWIYFRPVSNNRLVPIFIFFRIGTFLLPMCNKISFLAHIGNNVVNEMIKLSDTKRLFWFKKNSDAFNFCF